MLRLLAPAMLLGVFASAAAPAAASHVGCGDTITVSTTLDSNVVDCPGSGIIVGADNVTLDLNDHTVSGTDTTILGYPGLVISGRNATVRDGTVRGFKTGLEISGSDNVVRSVYASNNDVGICICGSAGMSGNRIESSVISDNDGGIGLSDAGGSITPGNVIRRNTIVGNTFAGVGAIESYNTRLVRNRVEDNGLDGINMGGDAFGSVVEGNIVNRNGDDGIDIDSDENPLLSTEITRNTANENGGLGIEAVAWTRDGGGNRAFGNGNPLQCLNIVCK